MTDRRFEEVEHTADIAIRVWGRDLAELFANAAYGMACQLADVAGVDETIRRTIHLEAHDTETLLVTWLGELLYLSERHACVFTRFDMLEVTPTLSCHSEQSSCHPESSCHSEQSEESARLRAVARGGPVSSYRWAIKAVTFSDLKIVRTDEGYETTIVFDV